MHPGHIGYMGRCLPGRAQTTSALRNEPDIYVEETTGPTPSVGDSQSRQVTTLHSWTGQAPSPWHLDETTVAPPVFFQSCLLLKFWNHLGMGICQCTQEVVSMWQFPGVPETELMWLLCSLLPLLGPIHLSSHILLLSQCSLACLLMIRLPFTTPLSL